MKPTSWMLFASLLVAGCGAATPEPAASTSKEAPASTPIPSVPYEKLLETAEKQVKDRNYNAALQTYSQAITAAPKRADAYLRRAGLLADAKLLAQAIADMTSAINLQPESPKHHNTRGYYLLLSQQYERAEADFNDAIGLDLNYPQPYNNRGLVSVSQGKYEEAIKDFDNALRINPKYTDALNNRGFAMFQLDRLEEAVAAFTQALEVQPDYVNSISNRGRAFLKLNRPQEAVADFTRALELQPDQQQIYVLRSEAYRAAGQEPLAAKDLEMIDWLTTLTELNQRIARNPRDGEAWATRGRHLLQQERFEEAEKSLKNALALNPRDTQALLGRAFLAMHESDYAQVITDCTEALSQDDSYEVHALRGNAYFEQGDYDKAISDYEAARCFDERIVAAYRKRGEKLRAAGEASKADSDEETARLLEKRLTEAAVPLEQGTPRAMVIEQVGFDRTATVPAEAPPVP
jgi:tetratricopeptide (TPR) repeat protein